MIASHVRMYRCYNCPDPDARGRWVEFSADPAGPVACPSCGLTVGKRGGDLITLLAVVHYHPPAKLDPTSVRARAASRAAARQPTHAFGVGHAACDARVTADGQVMMCATVEGVTCPRCRDTDAYREQAGLARLNPLFDVPVGLAVPGDADTSKFPAGGRTTAADGAAVSEYLRAARRAEQPGG